MPSSVCQGLQSCLEPRLVGPRVSMLKSVPLKPNSSRSFGLPLPDGFDASSRHEQQPQQFPPYEDAAIATTATDKDAMDLGSWKFFLGIVKKARYCNDSRTYIHPPLKHSSSSLSRKSLEMCTESLGSETGDNYGEEIYPMSLDVRNIVIPAKDQQLKHTRESFSMRRPSRGKRFPPPLSSISRFGGFQLRSHREGGRLIICAVSASSYQRHFHVERSNGRLRFGLLYDERQLAEQEMVSKEEEDDDNECIPKPEEKDGDIDVDEISGYNRNEEELKEELVKQEEEEDDDDIFKSKENRGSGGFIGVERGSSEFSSKTRRCSESGQANKGLLKWEAFLLAT